VCKVFARAWETHLTKDELARNHTYWLGDERPDHPQFVRISKFLAAEPRRHPVKRCRCGRPDRWKCWSRFFSREVLGGERVTRSDTPIPWDYDLPSIINPEPAEVVDIFDYFVRRDPLTAVHSTMWDDHPPPQMETPL